MPPPLFHLTYPTLARVIPPHYPYYTFHHLPCFPSLHFALLLLLLLHLFHSTFLTSPPFIFPYFPNLTYPHFPSLTLLYLPSLALYSSIHLASFPLLPLQLFSFTFPPLNSSNFFSHLQLPLYSFPLTLALKFFSDSLSLFLTIPLPLLPLLHILPFTYFPDFPLRHLLSFFSFKLTSPSIISPKSEAPGSS